MSIFIVFFRIYFDFESHLLIFLIHIYIEKKLRFYSMIYNDAILYFDINYFFMFFFSLNMIKF